MSGLQLKVRRISPTATLPAYQTAGAAGLDLHADLGGDGYRVRCDPERGLAYDDKELRVITGRWLELQTGIAVEIPPGYFGRVCGRSGLAFRDEVEFFVGTIDADYRGEIRVLLKPTGPLTIRHGDRIAQMLILPVAHVDVVEVEALDETARNAAGFGSTGR
jgi:dUTP pyrophosphatase